MIDCYLGLDQPFTAYRLLSEHEYEDDMMELSAEPLWRLGRFEQLEELVKKPVVSGTIYEIYSDLFNLVCLSILFVLRKDLQFTCCCSVDIDNVCKENRWITSTSFLRHLSSLLSILFI